MDVAYLMIMTLCIVKRCSATTEGGEDEKPLRLLGLLPSSGVMGWNGGQACLAPVLMALADINARADVLAGYQLRYSWIDTQCDPGVAVYRMFKEMTSNHPYIMLMGDGCSIVSEATSQVSYLFNISQVSYGASSPILSDRKRFPQFFRVTGPDHMLNPARIALMRHFNWKKVATINQAREFFSVVIDDFVNRVKSTDITILSQEIFGNSDPMTRVENLMKHDARIIITAMYEDRARKVLCAAYKIGMYGPKIVWVFVGWYGSQFWRTSLGEVDCTPAQMDAVVEGSLITAFFSRNPREHRGIANMTAAEFDTRLLEHPSYRQDLSHFDFVTARCYDHIWVGALGLDCADRTLKATGHNKSLHEFTYADSEINQAVFGCMSNVSFTGVSGNIDYGLGPDPIKNVKLEQIRERQLTEEAWWAMKTGARLTQLKGSVRTIVGQYRMDLEPNQFEWFGEGIQWKDGNVPRDSTYVIKKEVTIPASVYIPLATCSGIGITLTVAFFIFNVVCRKNPTVKLSSPNINNVLLLGCVLCYTTVFMKPTETSSSVICKARIFSFSLGFTVAFGALFSKTWRVYRIFTNKKLLRMTIKDYQLLAIICGLVVAVLSVLITWEIVGPQVMVVKSLDKEVYVLGNDAEVRPFVRMCHSEYSSYFSWVLYILEGALLSFGAFLAWETRHVKIEALNDSHQIGLCLYNVVVLSAVGLTLSLLLDQQIIILYGMTSGCLIIGTTVIQVVVFVPKKILSESQTDWILMRRRVTRRLIWIQIVCKGKTKVARRVLKVLAVFQKTAVVDAAVGSRREESRLTYSGSVRTTAVSSLSTNIKET